MRRKQQNVKHTYFHVKCCTVDCNWITSHIRAAAGKWGRDLNIAFESHNTLIFIGIRYIVPQSCCLVPRALCIKLTNWSTGFNTNTSNNTYVDYTI